MTPSNPLLNLKIRVNVLGGDLYFRVKVSEGDS